jgi:hypothetical protein
MRKGNQRSVQKAHRKREKRPPPYNGKLRKDQCGGNEIIDGIDALGGCNETVNTRQLNGRKRSRDKKYHEKSGGNSERQPNLPTRRWQGCQEKLLLVGNFHRRSHPVPRYAFTILGTTQCERVAALQSGCLAYFAEPLTAKSLMEPLWRASAWIAEGPVIVTA